MRFPTVSYVDLASSAKYSRLSRWTLPFTTDPTPGKVAYVVVVPASIRAPHQAADKRFYKRFNFESVPMEEYESRDTANRSAVPDLDIEFSFVPDGAKASLTGDGAYYSEIELIAVISNSAQAVAEYAVIHLFLDSRIELAAPSSDVRLDSETETLSLDGADLTLRKLTILWDRSKGLPIFYGISAHLPSTPLRLSIPKGPDAFPLRYTIGSPGMPIKDKWVFLKIQDAAATFMRLKES
jgi:hypothetical protein